MRNSKTSMEGRRKGGPEIRAAHQCKAFVFRLRPGTIAGKLASMPRPIHALIHVEALRHNL
ncbi:hypothetical protein P3G55_25540, partial [Leptospira sp. 96542]|nr:hypothetical protein [Leptospira sp. 96542]